MSTTAISTPAPTNVTQYQSGFAPEIAGYGHSMVGQAAALLKAKGGVIKKSNGLMDLALKKMEPENA